MEEERSRIRAIQMDNFRRLLSMRRIDRVPNARIRELCGVTKGVDERIDKGVLRWLAMWRGWRGTGLLRVYVGVRAGSRSVGGQRKR